MAVIEKIVSGGQTGVDRAALDAAIAAGIPHGGWCPKGRLAEDGPIAERYRLCELSVTEYAARTERNVLDSDGTLILYRAAMQGGTLLTHRLARQHGKPLYRVRLERRVDYDALAAWLREHRIQVLNVAGPRASSQTGIYEAALAVMQKLLSIRELPLR